MCCFRRRVFTTLARSRGGAQSRTIASISSKSMLSSLTAALGVADHGGLVAGASSFAGESKRSEPALSDVGVTVTTPTECIPILSPSCRACKIGDSSDIGTTPMHAVAGSDDATGCTDASGTSKEGCGE